jgi:EpsI family protein
MHTVLFNRSDVVRFLPYFICLVVWSCAYYSAISSVLIAWSSNGDYSHGFVSFTFAVYIIWRQRFQITCQYSINPLAIGLMILITISWWLGWVATVQKIEQFAAYLVLLMTLVALGGWKILLILRFPCLIIFLVMPIWHFLQKPLQELSILVTVRFLRLLDIPTFLEGNLISVPGGDFLVEESCAGLGFFLTALALVTVYSYLNKLDWIQSYKLAAISVIVAISANWIRIISILLVGNYQGMSHFIVTDHLIFGWVVFCVALMLFFWISHRWFPATIHNVHEDSLDTKRLDQSQNVAFVPILAICVALIVVPIAAQIHDSMTLDTSSKARVLPDNLEAGVNRLRFQSPDWEPVFAGAFNQSTKTYEYDGQEFAVLIVQYRRQEQGRELIHVKNRLYSKRWNEISEDHYGLNESPMGSVRVKSLSTAYKQTRRIAYWYVIGGQTTSSPIVAKILEVFGVLTGNRNALLVAVALDNQVDPDVLLKIVSKVYNWERSNI